MDTELLKTFIEVSRTRHFGRAAENLFLTQSAVSFRVRQLEGLLGVPLFVRHRNNIQLTGAGETLLPLAESSVALEIRIREEVAEQENKQKSFIIGACPEVGEAYLSGLSRCELVEKSSSALTFVSHSSSVLVRKLLERTLDLAVVLDPPKVEEIFAREIKDILLIPVASASERESLHPDRYIHMDWGMAFNQQLKDRRMMNEPLLSTNLPNIALAAMTEYGGWTYLPENRVTEGDLRQVQGIPEIVCPVYGCFLSASTRIQKIEQFIAQI